MAQCTVDSGQLLFSMLLDYLPEALYFTSPQTLKAPKSMVFSVENQSAPDAKPLSRFEPRGFNPLKCQSLLLEFRIGNYGTPQ